MNITTNGVLVLMLKKLMMNNFKRCISLLRLLKTFDGRKVTQLSYTECNKCDHEGDDDNNEKRT